MVPSHYIVTKLSRNSLNIIRRTSSKLSQNSCVLNVNIQRRNFITILNPSSPKCMKISRNSNKDASETAAESMKIVELQKALAEASIPYAGKLEATIQPSEIDETTSTPVKQEISDQTLKTSSTPEKTEIEHSLDAGETIITTGKQAVRDISNEATSPPPEHVTNAAESISIPAAEAIQQEISSSETVTESEEVSSLNENTANEETVVTHELNSVKAKVIEDKTSVVEDTASVVEDTATVVEDTATVIEEKAIESIQDESINEESSIAVTDIPLSTTNTYPSKDFEEDKIEVNQKKKVLTKKGKKKMSSKATSESADDDSSSSSSSSSDSSDSESESLQVVNTGRQRLDQVVSPPQLDLSKLKKVLPHVPKIKFNRKSSYKPDLSLHSKLTIAFNDQNKVTNDNLVGATQAPAVLEWWERPVRFGRQDVDTNEIEQINSGGAEKIFQ